MISVKTIIELCEPRDGVVHCGVVNRTDICSLLEVLCTVYFVHYILIVLLSFYIFCLYTIAFSVYYFVRSMCE